MTIFLCSQDIQGKKAFSVERGPHLDGHVRFHSLEKGPSMYSSPFLRKQETFQWPSAGDGLGLVQMQCYRKGQETSMVQGCASLDGRGILLDQPRDTSYSSRGARKIKDGDNVTQVSSTCSLLSTYKQLTATLQERLSRVR